MVAISKLPNINNNNKNTNNNHQTQQSAATQTANMDVKSAVKPTELQQSAVSQTSSVASPTSLPKAANTVALTANGKPKEKRR